MQILRLPECMPPWGDHFHCLVCNGKLNGTMEELAMVMCLERSVVKELFWKSRRNRGKRHFLSSLSLLANSRLHHQHNLPPVPNIETETTCQSVSMVWFRLGSLI